VEAVAAVCGLTSFHCVDAVFNINLMNIWGEAAFVVFIPSKEWGTLLGCLHQRPTHHYLIGQLGKKERRTMDD